MFVDHRFSLVLAQLIYNSVNLGVCLILIQFSVSPVDVCSISLLAQCSISLF